ncbi:hypothetical protein F3Y22_tig00110418pilonHSYRG00310 [Hibiscus syriacus]|uniref:F-box domain-containing protein n=1 Tax=Hibiscus syriacus TaxID=106335 RepID=A0A6A3AP92_HIBSY|nr:hypothetical protein F3Y22_tig00110418pilonHSYRG00310 [Hibiscus syriacus]
MGNLGELNNYIPFDVLSRLPTKYMPRLKCVCKEWNRLISDPIFMKVQSQKKEPAVLSGFFFQQRYRWSYEEISTVAYIPVKKQDAEEAELFQTVLDFLPEHVVVLSSCNDTLGTSTKFKLIKVKQIETEADVSCFLFDIYALETRAWKKSVEICKCNSNLYKNSGWYVEGVFHWLTDGDEVLTFHVWYLFHFPQMNSSASPKHVSEIRTASCITSWFLNTDSRCGVSTITSNPGGR